MDGHRPPRHHHQLLADLARVAGSSLELEEVLERAVQCAAAATGAGRAGVLLLDPSGLRLLPAALWGMDASFTAQWKTRPLRLGDDPLSQEALATGLPVTVPDAAGDLRTVKHPVALYGDRSILVAPLTRRGRRLGALSLSHLYRPGAFSVDDVETTATIAGQVALALENAQLHAHLQEEQRRAQQAQQARTDFVSLVSHELRTPLALVKAYVATLLQPDLPLPEAQARSFLEGIDQASDRLQHLIDNLLSATSLDAGLFVTRPAPLEVGALLRDALEEVAMLVHGRPLRLDSPSGELWVLGDKQQLTQVIENLVANAVKYAPGDTPIGISISASEWHVRFSVLDGGAGIPAAALERIFEKFYRVTTSDQNARACQNVEAWSDGDQAAVTRRRRPSGMGLGLYICRRIVQAHGGHIWAENSPAGGAIFHVELPRRLHSVPSASTTSVEADRDAPGNRAAVLTVLNTPAGAATPTDSKRSPTVESALRHRRHHHDSGRRAADAGAPHSHRRGRARLSGGARRPPTGRGLHPPHCP